jgi:aspartyl-tRNA(Asn)/glutamyl-tRNA(Gln) amidotransferase subunit A
MSLPTVQSVEAALIARKTTSVELTRAVIDAARRAGRGSPNKNPFVAIDEKLALAAAAEADARRAAGKPLSAMDGVPIAVKDEIDVAGLPTRKGTSYMSDAPKREDAFLVTRLRRAGAVIVGKVHQHENGLGATGINPNCPVPRNPHHDGHAPGGSSSGCGAAVAAGLVPIAIGADGGGSIRIPASFCGVFGIKPTLGRTSRGGTGFDQGTLAVAGPLASSVADLELFLRLTSDIDPRDAAMSIAPELDRAALDRAKDVSGKLRVGVVPGDLTDADPAIAKAVQNAIEGLQAEIVEVRIPLLPLARAIGYVTFGVECASSLRDDLAKHRHRMGHDIRLLMALGERLSGAHFLHAQRLRARLRREVNEALRHCDVLLFPSTGCTAPRIRNGAETTGEVDDSTTQKATRYTFMGNLTGLPAASLPIGVDEAKMPIGLQLVGAAFEEATVLRAAYAFERAGIAKCPDARDQLNVLPT